MPKPADQPHAQLRELTVELAALKAENAWLKRQLFGPGKSEKLDRLQTSLPLAEPAPQPVAPKVETITYERVAAPREKRPVPAEAFKNVPVKETVVIEPEEVKADPAAFERIGEERTFEIDIVPPQVFKREIVRPKYRSKTDRSQPPVLAPALARPVSGGYASAGLLAWIALSKYVDHQPLYRLEQQSARWGAQIPRQTMVDWIRITAEWLEPVYLVFDRAFYISPNELRGFELVIPRACLAEKDGLFTLITPVILDRDVGRQGVHTLVLKRKTPNQTLEPTAPSGRGSS